MKKNEYEEKILRYFYNNYIDESYIAIDILMVFQMYYGYQSDKNGRFNVNYVVYFDSVYFEIDDLSFTISIDKITRYRKQISRNLKLNRLLK